jgi:hypothetical protein
MGRIFVEAINMSYPLDPWIINFELGQIEETLPALSNYIMESEDPDAKVAVETLQARINDAMIKFRNSPAIKRLDPTTAANRKASA